MKKEICEIANDNASGQVIVSGKAESDKLLQNLLKNIFINTEKVS